MIKLSPGDVVTIDKRGDQHDRESGRIVSIGPAGTSYMKDLDAAEVDLGYGVTASYITTDLVPFGLRRGDTAWAAGQAVVLLDAYPRLGVGAGQLGRVVAVGVGDRAGAMKVRARGSTGWVAGWVMADRLDRIPS